MPFIVSFFNSLFSDTYSICDSMYDQVYCWYSGARIGGVLLLSEAISYASGILLSSPESHMQKKMVVFAGGYVCLFIYAIY